MILATELRIGNLVSNTLGETKVVNTEILVYLLNDENNEFEPVVLTEELLLSAGYLPCPFRDNHFTIEGHTVWLCNELFMRDKNGIIIRYVHQLQNLYFALTGSELTFKTPSNNG